MDGCIGQFDRSNTPLDQGRNGGQELLFVNHPDGCYDANFSKGACRLCSSQEVPSLLVRYVSCADDVIMLVKAQSVEQNTLQGVSVEPNYFITLISLVAPGRVERARSSVTQPLSLCLPSLSTTDTRISTAVCSIVMYSDSAN